MDIQNQQPAPQQNAAPTAGAAPQAHAGNKAQAPQSAQVTTAAPQTAQTSQKPLLQPGKDQAAKNKRFIYACCSSFGCGLLLFLILIFVFIGVGGTTENPIFGLFGVSGPEVVNVIIALTNLIFGLLTFIAFVIAVIGAFKFGTTKKVEKENRKKALYLTFGAFSIMLLLIFMWIFAYLFLKSKQTPAMKNVIVTEPAVTLDLTAPVRVKFDASGIPINKRRFRILTYDWDFGDGETTTGGLVQTHQYTSKGKRGGRFDVVLIVTAQEIATGKEVEQKFTKIVTIANEQAQAVIKADPERGEIPLSVKFDASDSRDPDGEIQSFEWDLDEDTQFDDGATAGVTKTFDQVGTYKVTLRIAESDGSYVIAEKTIEALPSDEPVAVIEIEGVTGDQIEAVKTYTFTAAKSSSPAGKIKRYEWDFGDGTKKQTRTITYSYVQTGTYEITLKVEDEEGQTSEAVKRINVTNPEEAPKPVIETTPAPATEKLTGAAPFKVEFDASKSTDPNNDIVEYQWDFDGDDKADASDIKTSYEFKTAGAYKVNLTLKDAAGNEAKSTLQVQVNPPDIYADLKADGIDGEVPLIVQFDASGSSYPSHRIVGYEWDFGDDTEPQMGAAKISHQYTKIGTFTAKVKTVGEDNRKAEASVNINVRPVSLQACFTSAPETGKAPLDVLFDPGCGTGAVTRYKWSFGSLGQSRERKPVFKFERAGAYEVKLEVSDNRNTIDSFEKEITITQ